MNISMRKPRNGEHGFTLIELMVILAVLGVVAAIAISGYVYVRPRSQLTEGPIGGGVTPSPAVSSPEQTSRPEPMTQRVTDPSRLFTLELPSNWRITRMEGKKGVQLSHVIAESPDFRVREDTTAEEPFTPNEYEQGARFSIHVVRGRSEVAEEGARTVGLQTKEPVEIGGLPGLLRSGKSISTVQGRNLDAIVHQEGLNYIFTFAYNPETFPQGEKLFRDILRSFTFL